MLKITPSRYMLIGCYWSVIYEKWCPEIRRSSDDLTDCIRVAADERFDDNGREIPWEGVLDREDKRFIFPDELDRLIAEYRADIEADAEHEAREAQIIRSQR